MGVVSLLRIALGLRKIHGPRETVGQTAADELVELGLERPALLPRGLVVREPDRDSGSTRARGGVTFRVRAESLAEGGAFGDLGPWRQAAVEGARGGSGSSRATAPGWA